MVLRGDAFRRLCVARELLAEREEQPLSIRDIARESGMSHFHFIRQFEALFGYTPHQFRIQLRLDHAKHLLALGHHSVTDVCMEVGMSSLGSFSDLFLRRVGVAPSEYRQRARVQVPGGLPPFPGCLSLMAFLPASAFRNFREAEPRVIPLECVDANQADQPDGG
jgi:AraC-like DNA-binding protein